MNSPETMSMKNSIKKIVIPAGTALFIAGLYLGYTAFVERPNLCESLFEQTTRSVHQKIETLKKEGVTIWTALRCRQFPGRPGKLLWV